MTTPHPVEPSPADRRANDPLPVSAYGRAERMLGHFRPRLALRARVVPQWIGDASRFWYEVDTELGREFVVVDPEAGSRTAAFDHHRLAASLALACGTEADRTTCRSRRSR